MEKVQEERSCVPVCQKYLLTIYEAAAYFNIGINRLRSLAAEDPGNFVVDGGNRYLIHRKRFEAFLDATSGL